MTIMQRSDGTRRHFLNVAETRSKILETFPDRVSSVRWACWNVWDHSQPATANLRRVDIDAVLDQVSIVRGCSCSLHTFNNDNADQRLQSCKAGAWL